MKKIISLLASIAMLATMVTSVSAASLAANAPVMDTVVTELTADEYYNDWMGEELPAGQKAYLVELNLGGLDLEVKASGANAATKKKRDGVLLMYTGYALTLDKPENVAAITAIDGLSSAALNGDFIQVEYGPSNAAAAYPSTNDGVVAPVTADSAFISQFVMTTTGDIVGTVSVEAKVTEFIKDESQATLNFGASEAQQVAYAVNGVAGNEVSFVAAGGEDEEKVTEVVTSDKIDLEAADGVKGAAWDVTIKNFDSAKAYMATFTNLDNGEVRRGYSDEIDVSKFAETTGDVSFAVIMKLLTVTNVGLDIAIQ